MVARQSFAVAASGRGERCPDSSVKGWRSVGSPARLHCNRVWRSCMGPKDQFLFISPSRDVMLSGLNGEARVVLKAAARRYMSPKFVQAGQMIWPAKGVGLGLDVVLAALDGSKALRRSSGRLLPAGFRREVWSLPKGLVWAPGSLMAQTASRRWSPHSDRPVDVAAV